ncbi:MraY family glycosyltransferase [Thermogemmata fonticola]|jgi:UDP-GlcNAc:undecaprenyl-phosphate GlcNAc-1-phosphate transferase|uniref:Undecaprenyl/decaprenyl-phosphate alpha-N-acetylglucosaminyl 1-phosphate transferase n=1 Tax=Thermogemmata fonticola TaxID=2755323 RepID=A0A7V8VC41_9BACT|nr:MraY family glycosyltransferase [Thermogemmata fonticola]MBA2225299.1 undecaprenyl/decaprenyl-phosphate alpha-N-acetylglucosaminyl 1-phosphate transferase [Thermogemmata fonticola]
MTTVYMGHFLCGLIGGWLLTRLAIPWARQWGWLDYPDRNRKLHHLAVPLGGGVAVFLATVLTLCLGAAASKLCDTPWEYSLRETWGLFLAAGLILVLGLLDDRYNLRARYKLLGQVAAVLVLMFLGDYSITSVSVFGWVIELGLLSAPLTVLWLLACINALNLIDGMDGLLGTVSSIALASFGLLAVLSGHGTAAVIAFSLMGAVLGFLWWNLPPARIYMGDAGSMLIGLAVGALALQTSLKGPATVALGAPLAILVLPVFDTTAAILRRQLTGRGLAVADRGHIHHVLLQRGFSPWRILMLVAAIGALAAAGALVSMALQNDLYAFICAVGVVVTLVAGKWFGYAEWKLLRQRLATTAHILLSPPERLHEQELAVHLHGTVDWNLLWKDLLATARRLPLEALHFDVTIPSLHEDYHARWSRGEAVALSALSRITVPLWIGDMPVGQLHFLLRRSPQPLREVLQTLSEIVETLERETFALLPISDPPRPVAISSDSTTALTLAPCRPAVTADSFHLSPSPSAG